MPITEGLFGELQVTIPWPVKLLTTSEFNKLSKGEQALLLLASQQGYLTSTQIRKQLPDANLEADGSLVLKLRYLFSAPHSVPRCETGAAERGPSR